MPRWRLAGHRLRSLGVAPSQELSGGDYLWRVSEIRRGLGKWTGCSKHGCVSMMTMCPHDVLCVNFVICNKKLHFIAVWKLVNYILRSQDKQLTKGDNRKDKVLNNAAIIFHVTNQKYVLSGLTLMTSLPVCSSRLYPHSLCTRSS